MEVLPPLHALRCFEVTARHLSMSLASRELSVTHGAISRQVRLLEDHLGARLFVRAHRRLALTREGALLSEFAARAMQTLRDGVSEVRRARGGPVVLSCEPTLTSNWLIPRLARLAAGAEGLQLHVTSAGGPIDLEREGVDAALRRGDFALAGYHAAPVMDEWVGPVASPLAAAALTRRSARAKQRPITLLHARTRPDAWTRWGEATGRSLASAGSLTFDHLAMSVQAAVAGIGIAIGPYPIVEAEIRAGRLVAPYGFVLGKEGYWLLSRRPAGSDAKVAALLAWLRREGARTYARLPKSARSARARQEEDLSARRSP